MRLEAKLIPISQRNKYKNSIKVGDKFGNLTVTKLRAKLIWNKDKTKPEWRHECLCICGNYAYFPAHRLMNSKVNLRSCGCLIGTRYLGRGVSLTNNLILNYKSTAKARNIEWKLTDEEAVALFNCPCYYCGVLSSRTIKRRDTKRNLNKEEINFNGIDRLINEQGYTSENAVPCCILCNRIKMDGTVEEFLDKVKQIYNYLELDSPTLLEMCA